MQHRQRTLALITLPLAIGTTFCVEAFINSAEAQIVPDGTLGAESSVVTPETIKGIPSDRIDGGATRGANLFHSFQEFNVGEGRGAYFSNPAAIENILSRVTGSNLSQILGTLGVLGDANLFLINPNGIVFGPNARLDVGGSFVGSTADSLVFENGFEFSSTNPHAPPLLTINIPIGLQFRQEQLGNLANAGNLAVGSGENLTLLGGTVTSTGSLTAPGGTVQVLGELVGLLEDASIDVSDDTGGGNVFIGGNFQGRGPLPNAKRTYIASDVKINADALTKGDGGRVIVWADELTGFYGNISARGGSLSGNGGFVEVSGKEQLIFRGNVDTSAISGFPGTLLLDPANITIANGTGDEESDGTDTFAGNNSGVVGSILSPTPFPLNEINDTAPTTIYESELEGLSGDTNIKLQATNNITLQDLTDNELTLQPGLSLITFTADADKNGVGDFLMIGADSDTINTNRRPIFIEGANLTLGNINTSGRRGGRTILLEASNDILTGNLNASSSNSSIQNDIITRGGQVMLEAGGDITVKGGINSSSKYNTSTSIPAADGGEITLKAVGNIKVEGNISSRSSSGLNSTDSPSGNGGEITLSAYDGSINVNGNIESSSTAQTGNLGNGGDIDLDAGRNLTVGNIDSSSFSDKQGNAGLGGAIDLNVDGNLTAGNIDSSSSSRFGSAGDGREISLNVDGNLTAGNIDSSSFIPGTRGSGAIIGFVDDEIGDGGTVAIDAKGTIAIGVGSDRPLIETFGKNGGDVAITNPVRIELSDLLIDGSSANVLDSSTSDDVKGGDIRLEAPSVALTNTEVKTTAIGVGNAGNITIEAEESVLLDKSRLFTALEPGAIGVGGNIEINTSQFKLTNFSLIDTATFGRGSAGDVNVRADSISLDAGTIFSLTDGEGDAGNATFQASEAVSLSNLSFISTAVTAKAGGNGGDVTITSPSLSLTGGSQLQALTNGSGESGDIQLNLGDTLNISGIGSDGYSSGVFTSSQTPNSGKGGNITVDNTGTLNVSVSDGAVLSAQTSSTADGGNITVNANTVELRNGGQLFTNTLSSGNAGDIEINAAERVIISGVGATRVSPRPIPRETVPVTLPSTLKKVEPNNSIGAAQPLSDDEFSIDSLSNFNPNVELATRIPYVSIESTGDKTVDYYSFEVIAGTRAIFDIDGGYDLAAGDGLPAIAPENVNLELTLFDSQGNELASNRDASTYLGADGSNLDRDPYLRHVFTEPGTYFIEVKEESLNGISDGGTYNLQVSFEDPNVAGIVSESPAASGLFAQTQGAGDAGTITIDTPQLTIQEGAQVSAFTSGTGSAGSISIPNADSVSLDNSTISTAVNEGAIVDPDKQPSDIEIQTRSLSLTNEAKVTASTAGRGNAGRVNVDASDRVSLTNGAQVTTSNSGTGNAGTINLQTPRLSLTENSQVSSTTSGRGNAGSISVQEADSVSLSDKSSISTEIESTGVAEQPSNIEIQTQSLSLTNGSQVTASTSGQGDAGKVNIDAGDRVSLTNGAQVTTSTSGRGTAGTINLQTPRLSLTENSQVSSTTSGRGNAGSISVQEADSVSLSDKSSISTEIESTGVAEQPSDIEIQTRSLSLTNEAEVTASTSGEGDAGKITVLEADSVFLDNNSTISTAVNTEAEDSDAGSINLNADRVTIQGDSEVSAATFGGLGGSIEITANTFEATDGGQLRTTTERNQRAGNITLTVLDSVTLEGKGSGLLANTTKGSAGKGGSIIIDPRTVIIQDGARVAVNSQGTGEGGNIEIFSDSLTLDDSAEISAETLNTNGGDITLQIDDLLILRRNRNKISTSAGTDQAGGDGGNIDIDADFIVAFPGNSDISANAFKGKGGKVEISAQGLFGLVPRSREELISLLGTDNPRELNPVNLSTNDITAISQENPDLSGETSFDIEFELSELIELPEAVVDPTEQIAQNPCTLGLDSEFIITGRGGLPTNPSQVLSSDSARVGWVDPAPVESRGADESTSIQNPQSKIHNPIVPARGWVFNDKGEAILVGYDPTNSGLQRSRPNSPACPAP